MGSGSNRGKRSRTAWSIPPIGCGAALRSSAHAGVIGGFGVTVEYLRTILVANIIHGLAALVVLPAFFRVSPIPHFLILRPTAANSLQGFFVFLGVAGESHPVSAQLDNNAGELQQLVDQGSEFLCGFGGLVVFVCTGVVLLLQDFKNAVMLIIDCLHGDGIAAAVRVMQLNQAAVFSFQIFKRLAIFEIVCHNISILF